MLLDGSHPEIVLVWIAVILIGIVGTSISGAAFGPARREQMLNRIRHLHPDDPVLATLHGSSIGGEDEPDFDHLLAAAERGVYVCVRRRGSLFFDGLTARATSWQRLRPVVADRSGGSWTLWLAGDHGEGDVVGFLDVARPFMRDPSGCLGPAKATLPNVGLEHVLHGAAEAKTDLWEKPPAPAMLATTADGILIVTQPMQRWRSTPPAGDATLQLVVWRDLSTVEQDEAALPTVRLTWARDEFTLYNCVMGDPQAFVQTAGVGATLGRL
jgi:hypothetical protein